MKIALLGKGKTGSKVIELCKSQEYSYIELEVFDSKNPLKKDDLNRFDIVLSFLNGDVFLEHYFKLLSESGICVVTGSTGFAWTPELVSKIKSPWIKATNFSLGMNLAKEMIRIAAKAQALFPAKDLKYEIHEVHHTKKLDAPSGTALSWQEWLDKDSTITSERTGDIIGIHELKIDTPNEYITIKHEAKDRKIFAAGALWACQRVKNLSPGLHDFSDIARQVIREI
ncbi:dihydrodipicolinate reductase domain protein [Bacteriovorax sp. BAL6_X]|uniref:4-hydroxy-tetrahydrodipicolinate reductase n=1 Tax=Bacteriovorax sp. BAL6_X TaxID=1201290 RepID=UPI000385DD55|nr:dihydrodipicolinate reductase C-terminal domain-containing protein [Bacteriovorax sp. BAL6_X]EPZ51382.1 dihydrodipicolinate reductase domain protein [Bacteriovorax sp. BAL6_X]